jgi:DNA-binding sugar fermentation-stimulating protein
MQVTDKQTARFRSEPAAGNERIDVVLRNAEGGAPVLEIRSLRWGRGVGWYVQKTIRVGPQEATQLGRALRRLARRERKSTVCGKVLPFPLSP